MGPSPEEIENDKRYRLAPYLGERRFVTPVYTGE
jgi:hypothetical protein